MRATSSFLPPPCRTSRPWRSESSGHHPHGGAYRPPDIAHGCVRVRVKVAANRATAKPNGPARLSRVKITRQHTANRRTYFFNSIGHSRHIERTSVTSTLPPLATELLCRSERRKGPIATKVRCSKLSRYSITSSARDRKDSGIVSPSALAVFRLTITSNLVGN